MRVKFITFFKVSQKVRLLDLNKLAKWPRFFGWDRIKYIFLNLPCRKILWKSFSFSWRMLLVLKKTKLVFNSVMRNNYNIYIEFFKYFFGVTCPFWLSLLFLFFFCHQVVHLIHLVFGWTRELNTHPRTMAQTVSPWCSPLDQGASPTFI